MADYQFDTEVVHGGERLPRLAGEPTTTPVYATSTFLCRSAEQTEAVFSGQEPGFVYNRYGNPTVTALEAALAGIERGAAAVAFGSGMAALHAALLLCEVQSGDVVLAARDIYGASLGLLTKILGPLGIDTRLADFTDPDAVSAALEETPRPRAVLFEVISNPLVKVTDVRQISERARRARAKVIVDGTFSPPPLIRPLELGADLVVHSATKYFSGHADATGGAVVLRDEALRANLHLISRLTGGILSPFEAHLIHRGLKTLALRLDRQCANALHLARRLGENPGVARVYYPGRPDHPQHALSSAQFQDGRYGAMLAFELKDGRKAGAFRFLNALRLVIPATTLGDVYSEVSYPPISSHREWPEAQRRQAGIVDGLIRLSAGIEHPDDILADLEQAIAVAQG